MGGRLRSTVVAVPLLLLGACASSAELAGPCVIREHEPALTLTTVVDAATGHPLALVRTEVLTVDGERTPGPPVSCEPPCAVRAPGRSTGVFEIRVSAPGYRPGTLTAEADWASGEGGCPGWVDDGATASTTLAPRRD